MEWKTKILPFLVSFDLTKKFKNKNISIVEFMPELVMNSFDSEFSEKIKEEIGQKHEITSR